MKFDIEKLTLGEVAKVEELSGQSVAEIGNEDAPKGKAMAAMAFVAKRRTDAQFTWNQAMGLTLDEAQEILGTNTPEDADAEEGPTSQEPAATAPSTNGSKPKKNGKQQAPKA